jgi:hypothetical protein
MALVVDKTKKLVECITLETKRVLIVFYHGVGDVILFLNILEQLRTLYPLMVFDMGLCKGLDQEKIIPGAVLLDGNWREHAHLYNYDIVFVCNLPLEDINNPNETKAEVSCREEFGIPPVSGHRAVKPAKLVGVHFQMTSIPWVANPSEETARLIWDEVIEAGYIPIETLMTHPFHNPANGRYPFVVNHIRDWPARLDTLMAVLGACERVIAVASGNWHLAVSVLGPKRVALLEKDLKVGHFTKEAVKGIDIKDYVKGSVKEWLLQTI